MNFLSSLFLWMIPLISIPLIIHLLNKRNIITIEFSSIQFLKALETESIRKLQLLQLLLMILRSLIIFCIIFMMARPVIGGFFSQWSDNPESTITSIIIDDTFSMNGIHNGQNREYLIQNIYKNIIEPIHKHSQIYIATASKGRMFYGLKENLPELSKILSITVKDGLLTDQLEDMLKDIEGTFVNKELYYINDGQQNQYHSLNSSTYNLDEWNVYNIQFPLLNKNLSIINAHVKNEILIPNSPIEISVTVKNNGTVDITNSLIQIFVNEISVGQQLVDIRTKKQKELSFITALPSTGIFRCKLKSEDDDNIIDNEYNLMISLPEKINILTISSSPENTLYTENAVRALNHKSTLLNYEVKLPDMAIQSAISSYDFLILYGYHNLSIVGSDVINYVGNGGHAIIFPDEQDETANEISIFHEKYQSITPISLTNDQYQQIDRNNLNKHPILSLFKNTSEHQNRDFKIFKYFPLPMTSQSWMTTENMESIWSHFEEGNGVVEIFSISTNLNWSTLPLKGNFVPFIHNLIYQSMHLNLSSLYVGEKWKLDGNKLIGTNTIHYASPGNPAVKKFVPQDLMLQPSDAIGFHSILRDSRTVSQVAFNAAFDELNSPLLSYDEIDKLVKLPINHIDASDEITTHIKLAQTGTELWRIFLIILILLIVTEMLISNYGNHQKSK